MLAALDASGAQLPAPPAAQAATAAPPTAPSTAAPDHTPSLSPPVKIFCDFWWMDELVPSDPDSRLQRVATAEEADVVWQEGDSLKGFLYSKRMLPPRGPASITAAARLRCWQRSTDWEATMDDFLARERESGAPDELDVAVERGATINRFPHEGAVVLKHYLAETMQMAVGPHVAATPIPSASGGGSGAPNLVSTSNDLAALSSWVPLTYDLTCDTHLAAFTSHFLENESMILQERERAARAEDGAAASAGRAEEPSSLPDNHWIVKPVDAAKSNGTTVTQSLACVLKLATTGPKIVQKYIERPALYKGHKFDLRFMALVRSFGEKADGGGALPSPPEVYVWNDFWCGLANRPYELGQNLDDPYCHLTKMHFFGMASSEQTIPNPDPDEFIREFESTTGHSWAAIRAKVDALMRAVLVAAVARCPGMRDQEASRAMYGFDVMFTEDYEPRLLEVQYDAACKEGFRPTKALACLLFGDVDGALMTRLM